MHCARARSHRLLHFPLAKNFKKIALPLWDAFLFLNQCFLSFIFEKKKV